MPLCTVIRTSCLIFNWHYVIYHSRLDSFKKLLYDLYLNGRAFVLITVLLVSDIVVIDFSYTELLRLRSGKNHSEFQSCLLFQGLISMTSSFFTPF